MAGTYTQFYVHLVFAVKNRRSLIDPIWQVDLEKYIAGIISEHKHKVLAIGSMPDHIHIFIGYNPNQKIPDLVETIKTSSNAWIKYQKQPDYKFEWQKGYGAFSYSKSHKGRVCNYVLNQKSHHAKATFRNEYYEILQRFEIDFKPDHLFDFFNQNPPESTP